MHVHARYSNHVQELRRDGVECEHAARHRSSDGNFKYFDLYYVGRRSLKVGVPCCAVCAPSQPARGSLATCAHLSEWPGLKTGGPANTGVRLDEGEGWVKKEKENKA